ncbi:hypothetical protein E2C01_048231 [Portunus trituberculatus]|uniref:Uncharacterized protein n=1 Tax=Portunus trituberculatus TaxID=210409 RepID=A0A5B7G355_PORTR|nr:hypothetical protein [Portunus trituberculatus]
MNNQQMIGLAELGEKAPGQRRPLWRCGGVGLGGVTLSPPSESNKKASCEFLHQNASLRSHQGEVSPYKRC